MKIQFHKTPFTEKELINKIKSLEEIYKRNLELKMYEACVRNSDLISHYTYELKQLNIKEREQ